MCKVRRPLKIFRAEKAKNWAFGDSVCVKFLDTGMYRISFYFLFFLFIFNLCSFCLGMNGRNRIQFR